MAYSLGRVFMGLAVLASGILQLATGELVRLVPRVFGWPAPHPLWAYLSGVVLVALGAAILSGRLAVPAAAVLGVLLVVLVFFVYLPRMTADPRIDRPLLRGFMYTNPLKSLALAGGAALLFDRRHPRARTAGAVLMAAFLVVCGLQHFAYRGFVVGMVPAWMPGRMFWTCFTGAALIAGGVGVLVPRTARLAAGATAVMIFLWVLMLHIPRAVSGPARTNETAGTFEALALSGVALLIADTRRRPEDGAEVGPP
jgi:uncharacterized membrane protein YphA (DoxX/SURF4 family)